MKQLTRIMLLVASSLLPMLAAAQVCIGMRDSHYVHVSYAWGPYSARFEQSIYAEKLPCQTFRVYAGYQRTVAGIDLKVEPYYGRTYNTMYWAAGGFVSAAYQISRVGVYGTVNPTYDSALGYDTCFALGASVGVGGPLAIVGEYTTIPEYRMSERRLRGGLQFRFERFAFRPLLSLPVSGNGKAKSLRLSASFTYEF